ncbi:flagellar biosynthesis protein FliW [Aquaspirillum sp. LM1]|jgi:flagellar assembly factor FliW|uniref:flagellar assembly protein FliW n=1 Tax=Aquaspirillum sp. LM1 TaxID=1938604 RepID=UPI000983D28B|nr:flagellar assembly protein FliW [Aquaspirillum sp. LM1]AQR64341.1 flagellar biosynthesis protein FliW [Aquaspirillum sp. LM1]
MLFQSNLLGQVTVDENTVLNFPLGLPGFESCQRFKLFHEESEQADSPRVFWMQSLDDADVLFSVVAPEEFGVRYEVELSAEEVDALQLANPEDALVLVMIYKGSDAIDENTHPLLKSLSANLRNPLIINSVSLRGLQLGQLQCDMVLHNRAA